MSKGPFIPSGTLWMTYSYGANFALQGAYFIVLARTLGAGEYGLFAGAFALAATFSALAGLGAGNVLVMKTSRDQSVYRAQLGTSFLYVVASFVPLALIAAAVGGMGANDILPALVPLLFSELLFTRVLDYGLQSFQAHDRLRGTAHLNVAAGAVRLAMVVVFAGSGGGSASDWALWYAACNVVLAVTAMIICVRFFGGPKLDRGSVTTTWRTGVFFSLGMASRTVYADADKFLLVRFGLFTDAGQYSAAYKIMSMAFAPIQALVYSSNTRLFRAGQLGFEASWALVRRMILPVLGYGVVATTGLMLLAPLIPLVLGQDFVDASAAMMFVAPILITQGMHYVFGDALMGLGKQSWRSICQLTVALVSLSLNIWLIPIYGWEAAAVVALGSSTLLMVLTAGLFLRGLAAERRRTRS